VTTRLLTTRQAAKHLGVGTTSIKRWADEGVLRCERTAGGHRRFRLAEIERFRQRQRADGEPGDQLSKCTPTELDALEYGVIRLADDGRVLLYNAAESALSGLTPEQVVGRDFFTQVAPCTNNRLLRDRFLRGVQRGDFDFELAYTFTYRMRPTNVRLHVYREPDSGANFLLVRTGPAPH